MNISCAPQGIVDFKYPKQGIGDIAGAGFKQMLFNLAMLCPANELEYVGKPSQNQLQSRMTASLYEHPEKMYEYMCPALEQCQMNNLECLVAAAPYLNRNTKRNDLNEFLRKLVMESIRVCGQAGCKFLIVRPLFAGIPAQDLWENNKAYYLDLAVYAKQADVQILIENQCKDYNGHLVRGICSDGGQAAEWIDALNRQVGEERFGFCMDVGACSLCGQDMQDFAITLGKRIKAVILRDCNGHNETSMLPFTCVGYGQSQTDWLGLIRGLCEICFDGTLIMDFSSTAAAFSHLLRPQLLQLAKTIAEYFKLQIGMKSVLKKYDTRVIFGAGNMCRNYMKCYGEEFPPLFTCDNNASRWGEQFEGLEIKPPEVLKKLDADCAIFICNIYYKEIEYQLREMGIQNPIEYFNDEYMPSYYFDRMEYWKGDEQK